MSTDRFSEGFASWRQILASLDDVDMRRTVFNNAVKEVAGFVVHGLDRAHAVDELREIAIAYGLVDHFGEDAVQIDIATVFEDLDRAPPVSEPNGLNGKAQQTILALRATPYGFPDPLKMPPRGWLFAGHYVRCVVTATVAPGGFGKTTLALFEAISMALAGYRVWYLSGEDQREEIDRRIAAHIQHHTEIDPEQLRGRLFVDDKTSFALSIGKSGRGSSVQFDEPWLACFEAAIRADAIDVVLLDPFIGFHGVQEGDNGAIDQVIKRLAAICFATNCCIEINHHVRKAAYGQTELTVDDTRGGSAIVNAVRSSRVINRMSEREADLARIGYEKRSLYLRLDKGKRNMAPPEAATWFHLVSVHLPNGDNVQALEAWDFPAAFAAMSAVDVSWVESLLREKPRRASSQSPDWLGHYLGARFGRDTTEKDGAIWANKVIGEWMRNKVFKKIPLRDPETRKLNVPFYVANDYQEESAANVVPFKARDPPAASSLFSATDRPNGDDDTTSN